MARVSSASRRSRVVLAFMAVVVIMTAACGADESTASGSGEPAATSPGESPGSPAADSPGTGSPGSPGAGSPGSPGIDAPGSPGIDAPHPGASPADPPDPPDLPEFRRCIEQEGVELPSGGGVPPSRSEPDPVAVAAFERCQDEILADLPGMDQLRAYRACLTEHGVRLPTDGQGSADAPDVDDPVFKQADQACGSFRPTFVGVPPAGSP